jgi:hypothetical protein
MIRNVLTIALASGAMVAAGPALGAPGGGSGGTAGAGAHAGANVGNPNQAGANARVNTQGSVNANTRGMTNANTNSALKATTTTTTPNTNTNTNATNSQGLTHASPNGIAHASPNSVLARSGVAPSALPGLTTGLTVQNSGGTSIGTVNQIITGRDGSIRSVVVTSPTGQTFRLAPNTLSISGGVVTTTSTTGG